jgi:hypothetical protein
MSLNNIRKPKTYCTSTWQTNHAKLTRSQMKRKNELKKDAGYS